MNVMVNPEQNIKGSDDFDEHILTPGDTISFPVINEQVKVETKVIETGKLRIEKKITEENALVNVPLVHEEIEIITKPVNQYVDEVPEAVRYEGDTMIIPVLKEVSVVRILLVEEVHITRKKIQTQDEQHVTLRNENITIHRY